MVRATHVEAPALDAAERYPDLYGEQDEDEPEPAPGARGRRARGHEPRRRPSAGRADEQEPDEHEELTPMGDRALAVTEADDFDYRCPSRASSSARTAAQKVDTKGIERTGAQLVEALSHFGVEAKRDRHRERART